MKAKYLIAAACLAALSVAPASAQLLGGGGGGLGGSLGGALGGGGSGGFGGSLGGTLGGAGSLDRSIDLDNGRVGASGSSRSRADGAASGAATRNGKSRSASASGSADGSARIWRDTVTSEAISNPLNGLCGPKVARCCGALHAMALPR